MFTGIIEEMGTIKSIKNGEKSSVLTIEASKALEETNIGDSIATNGVCLTVTNLSPKFFTADVMAESLRRTGLGSLKPGDQVNLERALRLSDRLGGHMVTGHIDGVGVIEDLKKEDNAIWVTVSAGKDIIRYIVEKGSIAIDGISLTVAYVDERVFKVSIIPHTGAETTLLKKKIGDIVNLECDIVGKYIEKLFVTNNETQNNQSTITEDFLKNNGFL